MTTNAPDGPTTNPMSEMLRTAIREEEMRLAALQQQREHIDFQLADASQRLTMFRATLRVLDAEANSNRTVAVFARGAIKQAVKEILVRESPRFVHATDVLEELQSRGYPLSPRDPKATVVTAMLRMARERERLGSVEGVERKPGNLFRWVGRPDPDMDAERPSTVSG